MERFEGETLDSLPSFLLHVPQFYPPHCVTLFQIISLCRLIGFVSPEGIIKDTVVFILCHCLSDSFSNYSSDLLLISIIPKHFQLAGHFRKGKIAPMEV